MKLDLLYEVDVTKPWSKPHPYGQREREQQAYREAVAEIVLADKMGFNTIWAVEHHFREGKSHMPSPEVFLGHLAALTERIRLGFGVTLTPFGFTAPQRIAEKVATVDILSNGRVEWGTGRSTPMEQIAFGVDRDRVKQDWREAIQVVCGMWREEYFEYESPQFSFPRRMVTPKPVQDPHPPAWAAAVSDESAVLAGASGLGILAMSIMQPLERLALKIQAYRKAQETAVPITDVVNKRVAAYTLIHVTDDKGDIRKHPVWKSVAWWYRTSAQFIMDWELAHQTPEEKAQSFPLMNMLKDEDVPLDEFHESDMVIIGTADEVIRKLKRYADLGIEQTIGYSKFGYLDHESVMRSIEIMGKEVIPELEAYQPKQ